MADIPSPDEQTTWHRVFAVECNNRAWTLADAPSRTAGEVEELLDTAHAAALHWRAIGTEANVARAEMLLAKAHALAGSALGLEYARRCFAYFEAHGCPDWEQAFAHAVLAHAAHAAGETELHTTHYARAAELGAAVAAAEDRAIFDQSFRNVPKP